MKWRKKGSELDDYAKDIIEKFENGQQIILFGAGQRGEELRKILEYYDIFGGFIDNDPVKQEKGCEGVRVSSLEAYQKQGKNEWIVITASDSNSNTIAGQLERSGYEYGMNFFYYEEFLKDIFPILSFYYYQKLFVYLAQISVTERCTLHCKKCAHACHKVDVTAEDMTLNMAKKSADYFFQYVDVVNEFVLIGGEPLLYGSLGELVDYIGTNYREKIFDFFLSHTNGTIITKR